ncbi:MAG TPA: hypothetical protein EYN91_08960 [Candidatus Melainabacteria bacterium]|nr:hypothetical protein [Candidatus Melainabacteria bacterium]HIN64720.1 hypothetical protein [Candidatus Obscuribacterales bacterium]
MLERNRRLQAELDGYVIQLVNLKALEEKRAHVNIGQFSVVVDTTPGSFRTVVAGFGKDTRSEILRQMDEEIYTTVNQMAAHLRCLTQIAGLALGDLECKYNPTNSSSSPTDTSESKNTSLPGSASDGTSEPSSTPQASEQDSSDLSDIANDPFYGF